MTITVWKPNIDDIIPKDLGKRVMRADGVIQECFQSDKFAPIMWVKTGHGSLDIVAYETTEVRCPSDDGRQLELNLDEEE